MTDCSSMGFWAMQSRPGAMTREERKGRRVYNSCSGVFEHVFVCVRLQVHALSVRICDGSSIQSFQSSNWLCFDPQNVNVKIEDMNGNS